MKVVVLGAGGQLGSELIERFGPDSVGLAHQDVDITNQQQVAEQLSDSDITLVINAAAYNKVDQAESEPDVAYAGNALGPRNLAIACASRDLPLVHISTDYVFGGAVQESPWCESDLPFPNSSYSTSKLAGEYFVRSLCPRHFVIRTCGLYGKAARQGAGKGNFVETMLRLSGEREELRVVNDQHCTPTSAADLADWILLLSRTEQYGLYHGVNSGRTTWADFAAEIFRLTNRVTRIIPIPSSGYPTPAARPRFSLLNNEKLASAIGLPLRPWQSALEDYLKIRTIEIEQSGG